MNLDELEWAALLLWMEFKLSGWVSPVSLICHHSELSYGPKRRFAQPVTKGRCSMTWLVFHDLAGVRCRVQVEFLRRPDLLHECFYTFSYGLGKRRFWAQMACCSGTSVPLISILSSVNLKLLRDVPVHVFVMYRLKWSEILRGNNN